MTVRSKAGRPDEDECVEVTPHNVRLRKVELLAVNRVKAARRARAAAAT